MYYPCSENKGADQLRSYCEADLRLCFRLCRLLVFPSDGSNNRYWLLSAYHAATNKLAKSMLLMCDSLIGMSDQSRIFIDPYIGLSRLMKLWSRKYFYTAIHCLPLIREKHNLSIKGEQTLL